MSSDVELIVKAIESLQTNVIKDYILPVGTVLISGGLGVGSAYYAVDKQEQNRIEIEKIKVVNNTLLTAMDVRMSLISIKENYFYSITNYPIQRILDVPPIILSDNKVKIELASLSFIIPQSHEGSSIKWENIGYISSIFSNYNSLLDIWSKRNDIFISLIPKLNSHMNKDLDARQLQEIAGQDVVTQLSDLTEQALNYTDDLLIEISAFLLGFSEITRKKIDIKVANKFGQVLEAHLPTYSDNPKAVDILNRIPEVNYTKLSELSGRDEDNLRKSYQPMFKQLDDD